MATFLVTLERTGPEWQPSRRLEEQSGWAAHAAFMDGLVDAGFVVLGGPLADQRRVALAVEADSDAAVRSTLARDPWSGSHLLIAAVDPWTIRLDQRRGRQRAGGGAGQPSARIRAARAGLGAVTASPAAPGTATRPPVG